MKTLYATLFVAFLALFIFQFEASAQQELVFQNSSLKSGTAKADGAVYLFPNVSATQDALVTISGRSSNKVTLSDIDITDEGFDKSFQPKVAYNDNNNSSPKNWWMDFTISFVKHGTMTSSTVDSFNVTAIDIDGGGSGSSLREYDAFYSPLSYTLEQNTVLTASNFIVNNQVVGYQFTSAQQVYNGIDTTQTKLMVTLAYKNVNSMKVRFGGTSDQRVSEGRMYSIWFKSFEFETPLKTLPVKLASFDATLNNKSQVDLKWVTTMEENVSHFVVQRSFDGINFSDAGLVFATGNSNQKVNYSLSDNISKFNATVIYYRLCSVDVDGKFSYSEVRIIRISKQDETTMSIITYPNPVSNELRITVPANWQNKKISFELFNANGQLMKRTDNNNSSQTETIRVNDLNSGIYIVRVSCNGQTAQQKIVKN